MPQYLRTTARRSRVLRHASRVAFVCPDISRYKEFSQRLGMYFQHRVTLAQHLSELTELEQYDALIFGGTSAEDIGLSNTEHLAELAAGRQVVCDLGVFADLFDDSFMHLEEGAYSDQAFVKQNAYYMTGFRLVDTLPWRGSAVIKRGSEFGWRMAEDHLHIALETARGGIIAMEQIIPGDARIAALDFSALAVSEDDGFQDLAALLIFEAIGKEAVDMGQYISPWLSYNEHISMIDFWASLHPNLVATETLPQRSTQGRPLKLIKLSDDNQKPTLVFSCCTHGHEQGPTYAVFKYLRQLVDDFERGHRWARTVLENFSIAWMPIVSADGFQATWERGVIIPHSPTGVDLNRNFPVHWDTQATDDRSKGSKALSEPESHALADVIHRYSKRGRLYIDFHECCDRDVYYHSADNPHLQGVSVTLEQMYRNRFLGESLSGYARSGELTWSAHTANQGSRENAYTWVYANHQGYPLSCISETFGNDDLTPYQIIPRIDATATLLEHMIGGVLGRTAYNHQVRPRTVHGEFPELNAQEKLRMLCVTEGNDIRRDVEILAADGFNETLEQGERLIVFSSDWEVGL